MRAAYQLSDNTIWKKTEGHVEEVGWAQIALGNESSLVSDHVKIQKTIYGSKGKCKVTFDREKKSVWSCGGIIISKGKDQTTLG